jgi:hypothetical protein
MHRGCQSATSRHCRQLCSNRRLRCQPGTGGVTRFGTTVGRDVATGVIGPTPRSWQGYARFAWATLIRAVETIYHDYLTGLILTTITRRDPASAVELVFRTFRRQHLEKFWPGLEKLGLMGLPHAVACAPATISSRISSAACAWSTSRSLPARPGSGCATPVDLSWGRHPAGAGRRVRKRRGAATRRHHGVAHRHAESGTNRRGSRHHRQRRRRFCRVPATFSARRRVTISSGMQPCRGGDTADDLAANGRRVARSGRRLRVLECALGGGALRSQPTRLALAVTRRLDRGDAAFEWRVRRR